MARAGIGEDRQWRNEKAVVVSEQRRNGGKSCDSVLGI
jgi:hypothetical protein